MFTDDIIRRALDEDVGAGDLTGDAIIPKDLRGKGVIVAKSDLVIAGLGVAGGVFLTVDPTVTLKQAHSDGDPVVSGTTILEVSGNFRALLRGERVALNFLQRLCGIATLTAQYVKEVGRSKTKILDTRKTIPLMRHLDKYAVRMGGGVNHRSGLFDAILIKENHLSALKGDVKSAVQKAKKAKPGKPIIVEVTKPEQVTEALSAGAQRVLLDNMDDAAIAKSVQLAKGKIETEASGGITLKRVKILANLGVDFISVGALTHSVKASDLSLEIEPI